MKIATFNINDINKRLDNLLDWLAEAEPDIVCLQELKARDEAFPREALKQLGYGSVHWGQSAWNGVAILARRADPVLIRRGLPGAPHDGQARYIEAAVRGLVIGSIYLPNGNPCPGPKFDFKRDWFRRLADHAAARLAARVPIVLAGDFNVAPTEADIYPDHGWADDALLHPDIRAAFGGLIAQGWMDALRERPPPGSPWTFWSYRRKRWPADKGLRLDHLLLSPDLASRTIETGVDRWVRGAPGASDHAPAWVRLAASSV